MVICNWFLQLKCVVTYAYLARPFATKFIVTYDKMLGCINVAINDNLFILITNSIIIMTTLFKVG